MMSRCASYELLCFCFFVFLAAMLYSLRVRTRVNTTVGLGVKLWGQFFSFPVCVCLCLVSVFFFFSCANEVRVGKGLYREVGPVAYATRNGLSLVLFDCTITMYSSIDVLLLCSYHSVYYHEWNFVDFPFHFFFVFGLFCYKPGINTTQDDNDIDTYRRVSV